MSEPTTDYTDTLTIPEPENPLKHPLESYIRSERFPHIWWNDCDSLY